MRGGKPRMSKRLWGMIREGQDGWVGSGLDHGPGCQEHKLLWEAIDAVIHVNDS